MGVPILLCFLCPYTCRVKDKMNTFMRFRYLLAVMRKVVLYTCMHCYLVRLETSSLTCLFLFDPALCIRAAKAFTTQCVCAGSSKASLLVNALIIKISRAGSVILEIVT